ncbi:hypothetical protein M422DRAFT_191689 [Sphaerobolus stellatus SS14]|uniref:Cytochrome P450 n=1 Tax=Sphaerobolus stellatus (strain SS14) TaxID=990650 RepID=A0A0C9TYC8_SPHS4|nr:hypothetical protein M422DRAFT_191689 [Sphaerobolus stellatus SS14]
MVYGHRWRSHRQVFHQHFNLNMVPKYRPVQLKSTRSLLLRLLDTPDAEITDNLQSSVAGTILEVVYGYNVASADDYFLQTTERSMTAFNEAVQPGKFLVETFPLLQHIPRWFPGAGFKRLAEQWRIATIEIVESPFDWAKSEMSRGGNPSIVASMMQEISDQEDNLAYESEKIMKSAVAIASMAGTDTSRSAIALFILAMAMHPSVQQKAQAEIDSVVGTERLPDFNDRDSLPYVNAVLKETVRWHNIDPLNNPRLTTEDDAYDGYFIPKGTLVVSSIWYINPLSLAFRLVFSNSHYRTMLHDPTVYPDPFEFKPERFIKDGKFNHDVLDPYEVLFGHGRRVCPGRHFAKDTLFITAASIFAALNISAPLDGDGRPQTLVCEMTDGIVSYVNPFDCVIKPRSKAAAELIKDNQSTLLN